MKAAHSPSSWGFFQGLSTSSRPMLPILMVLLFGCGSETHVVTYRVEGGGVAKEINYIDENGADLYLYDVELPWIYSFDTEGSLPLFVTAECDDIYILMVSIYVDGELVSSEIRQGGAGAYYFWDDDV